MTDQESTRKWEPTIFHAEALIDRPIAEVWDLMVDYRRWNPSFVGAEVSLFDGRPDSEGEVVIIEKPQADPFFCKTVRRVQADNICWYLYNETGIGFRHFVDFSVRALGGATRFNIRYFAQYQLSAGDLALERERMCRILDDLAATLKTHCERRDGGAGRPAGIVSSEQSTR